MNENPSSIHEAIRIPDSDNFAIGTHATVDERQIRVVISTNNTKYWSKYFDCEYPKLLRSGI